MSKLLHTFSKIVYSKKICSAVIVVLAAAGCAATKTAVNPLIKRLNSRGPVTYSADNPYLAASLLLNQEIERSAELRGFIDHRGAPAAIQVESEIFGPYQLKLFYPDRRERYDLEAADGTWIINSPVPIAADEFTALAALRQAPTDQVQGVSARSAPAAQAPQAAFTAQTGQQHAHWGNEFSSFQQSAGPTVDRDALDSTYAELIRSSAGHTAELSPRGDVVHYVSSSAENLAMIARWYSGDQENTGRIARINNLRGGSTLSAGDTIIIPNYLVSNRNRLSEECVVKLAPFYRAR